MAKEKQTISRAKTRAGLPIRYKLRVLSMSLSRWEPVFESYHRISQYPRQLMARSFSQ